VVHHKEKLINPHNSLTVSKFGMSSSSLTYINAEDLAAKVNEGAVADGKVVVVDVRGEGEFSEGHIKGANNIPSTNWSDPSFVDGVIQTIANSPDKTIVLHCAHSQQRGPTCARILQDRLDELAANGGSDSSSAKPSV
jgi:Cdc25 family phosphatase